MGEHPPVRMLSHGYLMEKENCYADADISGCPPERNSDQEEIACIVNHAETFARG